MMQNKQRILLIVDTVDILIVVSKRLESWGYEALTAESGEEGLVIAERERPDLILLDIMMPKMKGRDVCARLKTNPATQQIPVIFLTALGLADHIRAGMDLGADDYIVKPFEPAELKERIAICLARRDHETRDTGHERRDTGHGRAIHDTRRTLHANRQHLRLQTSDSRHQERPSDNVSLPLSIAWDRSWRLWSDVRSLMRRETTMRGSCVVYHVSHPTGELSPWR